MFVLYSPVTPTIRAVIVQTIIVSRKTSVTPAIPSLQGCSTIAEPWAKGAVPSPASLEYIPRVIPYCKALAITYPPVPPATAFKEKASLKIVANIIGTWWIFNKITKIPAQM